MDKRAIITNPRGVEVQNVDLWSFIQPYLSIYKERNAFICKKTSKTYTYGDVYTMSLRWANVLEELFPEKSPNTVVFSSNHGLFPIIYYGTHAAGGVVCPLMENYTEELLAYIVKTVDADVILVENNLLPLMQIVIKRLQINPKLFVIGECHDTTMSFDDIVNSSKTPRPVRRTVDPGSGAFIFFSSGTTGEPKGIVQSHRSMCTICMKLKHNYFFPEPPEDGSQCFYTTSYPMAHVGSVFLFMIIPLALGDCTVVLDFNNLDGINEAIKEYKVRVAFLRPFAVNKLLQLPNAEEILASVKYIATIGSTPDLQNEMALLKRVPHIQFRDGYGLTETLLVTATPNLGKSIVEGTVAVPGGIASIRDPKTGVILDREQAGMIHLKSECIMNEYLHKPEVTKATFAEDGHLITGDVGYITMDGRLVVIGREIDVMVIDGKTVMPSIIEDNLGKHPAVAEVAVIGTPHIDRGQVPKAFVILKNKETSAKELEEFGDSQTNIPEQKLAGGVAVVDQLPRNALGKVLKKELRRWDWGEGS